MISFLVLSCVAAIAVPFVAYPVLLWIRSIALPQPIAANASEPHVALLIAAHNEAASIGARLENALALDYPREKLSILVASDGSTDQTVAIARAFEDRGVVVLDLPRGGKAAALTKLVAASRSEVLAFTDANSEWRPDALRQLVRPFGDPNIGGVAGDQRYVGADRKRSETAGERGYWSFDRRLKQWQSRAGNAISATGAIYAIRRELFEPPPPDATDDFMISTGVIAAGRRLVFNVDAVALEPPAETGSGEYARKVRITTRGLRAVGYRRALLNPATTGLYALELGIHKLWRRLTWLPLAGLVLLAPLAVPAGGLAGWVSGLASLAVGIGVTGHLWPSLRAYRPISVLCYVLMVNAACAVATLNALRGNRVTLWDNGRTPDGLGESTR